MNGHIRPQIDWSDINTENVDHISTVNDLPEPDSGTITLQNRVYKFDGFVSIPYSLDISNSPVFLGNHGSQDGLIYTGGGTALSGTNGGFFGRDFYFHAPGGTMFDISGDTSTEMLVESCAFSNAAGIANIADMGTIDGFRVPSFKGCNFEDYNQGLTFTGTSEKVFFENCPLRGVTSSNVTIIEFDSNFETDIVDMANDYVKGVQSDTVVIDVDPSATINEIYQYRGITHDSTVTEDNILTGQAGVDAVGYRVSDSYPLENSKSYIDYTLDAEATTTITTQASSKTDGSAYVRINGTTTERGSARFSHADNQATYEGKRDRIGDLTAVVSLGTGTSDIISLAWFQNGNLVPGTATRAQMNQQGGGIAKVMVSSGVEGEMSTDDTFDVRVANLGSTTNITVGELAAKLST